MKVIASIFLSLLPCGVNAGTGGATSGGISKFSESHSEIEVSSKEMIRIKARLSAYEIAKFKGLILVENEGRIETEEGVQVVVKP